MKKPVTIIFEAHGTTFDNEAHLSSGWNDVALSPLASSNRERWACGTRTTISMRSSPRTWLRAYRSAEIGFGDRWPIIRDKRLRECDYGDLTQKPSELVDAEKPGRIHVPFPNGESYDQTLGAHEVFLDDLRPRLCRQEGHGHRSPRDPVRHRAYRRGHAV